MAEETEKEMGFLDHLEELRWRLVKSAIAVAVFATVAFIYKEIVFDLILLAPKNPDFITYKFLCWFGEKVGAKESLCMTDFNFTLQNLSMSGQFSTHITVSLLAGLVVAFPYVFMQLWYFIKPGLKNTEQKASKGLVFVASTLFTVGVLFGYYVVTPLSVQFLGSYRVSDLVQNQIDLSSFISTVTTTTLCTGVVFELPIVIYFLAKVGIVSPAFLKLYRKHAIVVLLILAAIITPPDVFSQVLVTLPLMLLYEMSIIIAKRVYKNKSL